MDCGYEVDNGSVNILSVASAVLCETTLKSHRARWKHFLALVRQAGTVDICN